ELCPAAARATASENRPSAAPYSELVAGGLLVERLHHMVFEGVSERFGWHRLNHGRGPQRGKERSTINFHVTSSIPGLRVAWLPRARCPRQARGARYATRTLEREAEHDLRDPHEPCLDVRLTEVGAPERARVPQCADVDAVEQIELLDFELRRLAAEAEVLDEHSVRIVLGRRTDVREYAWRIAERKWGRCAEGSRVDPGCSPMIGRRQPISIAACRRKRGPRQIGSLADIPQQACVVDLRHGERKTALQVDDRRKCPP